MPTALGFLNTTAQELSKLPNDKLISLYVEYDIRNFVELNDVERKAEEQRFGLKDEALTKAYNDSRVYELARAIYTREAERLINFHAQYATVHSYKAIAAMVAVGVVFAGALAATAPISLPIAAKAAVTTLCGTPAIYGMFKAASMFVHRLKETDIRSKQHMLEHHVYFDVRKDPHGEGNWLRFNDSRGTNQRSREPARLSAEAVKRSKALIAKAAL